MKSFNIALAVGDISNYFAESGPSIDAAKMSFPTVACDERRMTKGEGIVVPPNITNSASADDPRLPDPAFIDAVKSGRKTYFYIGCLFYEDIYGGIHHTHFCEYTSPNPTYPNGLQWLFCRKGNYAD